MRSPRQRRSDLESALQEQVRHFRRQLESKKELSDNQLEILDMALAELEESRKQPKPSGAITREARIAAYGARYDRHEELWHPGDAVHRCDLKLKVAEFVEPDEEGRPRTVLRYAVLDGSGVWHKLGLAKRRKA